MSETNGKAEPKSDLFHLSGDFSFSLKTQELLNASGSKVPLRAQSAEVLAHLAAHPGELISKDDLIDAVWGDTFVTDDSLVQCIGDIRKALGDVDRKIVETVPRKGYRLNVDPHPPSGDVKTPVAFWKIPAIGIVVVIAAIALWTALTENSPPHGTETPRIAVLAFDDFSAGEDKGYLSDAIA